METASAAASATSEDDGFLQLSVANLPKRGSEGSSGSAVASEANSECTIEEQVKLPLSLKYVHSLVYNAVRLKCPRFCPKRFDSRYLMVELRRLKLAKKVKLGCVILSPGCL